MALNQNIRDLADLIAGDLNEGRASRQQVGSKGVAFGWTAGLPVTLLSHIEVAQSASLNVATATVGASATPAKKVAAGTAKPNVATITTADVALPKYAGYAEITLEQSIGYGGILPALVNVLGAQILMALETDAIAALGTAKGGTADGADWVAALTAGQAKVLAAGGVPGIIVVSAADYGSALGDVAKSPGFATDPRSAVGSFLGSALHISPTAPTGTAYVLDPSAVLGFELETGPLALADPYSGSTENKVRVIADLFAAVTVVSPAHVIAVSKK